MLDNRLLSADDNDKLRVGHKMRSHTRPEAVVDDRILDTWFSSAFGGGRRGRRVFECGARCWKDLIHLCESSSFVHCRPLILLFSQNSCLTAWWWCASIRFSRIPAFSHILIQ